MGRVKEAYSRRLGTTYSEPPPLPRHTGAYLPSERLERALEDLTYLVHNVSPSEHDRILAFFFNRE